MAIGIRSYSTFTESGDVDTTQSPGSLLPAPAGLAIGDYFVIGVFLAQEAGTASIVTPSGFTQITAAGDASSRMIVTFAKAITNSTDLSAVSGGVYIKGSGTATRVVLIGVAFTGVASFSSSSAVSYTNTSTSSLTFNQPSTGDAKFFWVVSNNSSPSPSPVFSSTGGTKIVQASSHSTTGTPFSDSQIALMSGGTGATFSSAITNGGSVGFGLTASTNQLPVPSFTTSVSNLSVTVDGSASVDPDGTIASYTWDFGDGGTATGVTPAAHTYTASGTYTIKLTTVDNSSGSAYTTKSVTVSNGGLTAPTRIGYSFLNPGIANTTMVLDPSTVSGGSAISNGNWMIAAIAMTTTTTSVTPPTGWTTLKAFEGPNSLRYVVYGRIRQSGDTTYTFTINPNGGVTSGAVLMWGAGADTTITNWIVGTTAYRSVDLHNTSPALSKVRNHSLILGLSFERTTASETGITSVTGAIEWFFMPQVGSTQLETIDVAYIADKTPAGSTSTIDWVYPNSQTQNGAAFEIAIPPFGWVNTAPVASFTSSIAGLVVTVDGSGSSDADGTIASYSWDFGDGGTATGATPAAHTYATGGTYVVKLTVTDNDGASNSTTSNITVSSLTVTPPTRKGYSFTNPFTDNTQLTLNPSNITGGTAVSTGDWMIVALAFFKGGAISVTPPSGWTTLKAFEGAGTLAWAVFGRIRGASDTSYTFVSDSSGTAAGGVIMWGSGGDPTISNWIVGLTTNRSISTTNTGASITVTQDHSLVLGLSFERTTATETGITSLSGASEWFFMPQTGGQIETIDVAYIDNKSPAGTTSTMTWVYPNTQSSNGGAFQISIPPAPPNNNISFGYPAIYRTSGGTNYAGKLFYWDGSAAHDFTTTPVVQFNPTTVTQFLSSQHSPWFAAHRGFSYSYPEETLYSYRSATDWGIKAIEVSVQKSADGTFWCFHDPTTTRTTGTTGTIASMTDAQISVLSNQGSTATANPTQPARPTAKLVDVLNTYASTHVIIIEDKTYANTTAMLNLMDSYGTSGRPATEIFIWKVDGTAGASFYTPAASRGYHRWAYIFDSSMAASFNTLVTSGKADLIGMDYSSSDATLTSAIAACIANGVMPTGHIINSTTQRDRLLGLGMKGLMISNKDVVPPWYNIW